MKKLLFLFLLISFASKAQVREEGTVEVIPQVIFSSYSYYNNSGNHSTPLKSISFGIACDYYFNDRWSLHSGFLAQTMGMDSSSITDKLNYLNVPLNANWHFGSTRKWYLNFGVTPSFLMQATEIIKSTNGSLEYNIKGVVQPVQLGLNYGIGYKIETSKAFSILIDYQEFYGLTKTNKEGSPFFNAGGNFNVGAVYHFK